MPRYHFHVHDGVNMPDPEGTELPGLMTARMEALRLAGHLLKDRETPFAHAEEWRLDVTDGKGLLQFTMSFTSFDAPAARVSNDP
jgi:hypothetical protein